MSLTHLQGGGLECERLTAAQIGWPERSVSAKQSCHLTRHFATKILGHGEWNHAHGGQVDQRTEVYGNP